LKLFEKSGGGIIVDAKWLQPLSDPPGVKPLCREWDLKFMASNISGIFETGKGRNLLIFGEPGTGKTLCVRYLLNETRKHAEALGVQVGVVYVNAGKTRTPYYTMLEVVKCLGVNAPNSGWQMHRLKQKFKAVTEEKPVLIAIDEVETLLLKEREPIVYYLSRQPNTTLILICNELEDAVALPDRALSTLQPELLSLEPYTPEEATVILKERAEKALKPGAIQEKLIEAIAEVTAKIGDIRAGFSFLLSAALNAEEAGRKRIKTEDLESALKRETRVKRIKELLARKEALERRLRRRRR